MNTLLELLANGYVLLYVALIGLIQWMYACARRHKKEHIEQARKSQGLASDSLVIQGTKLKELKAEARHQAQVLILPIILLPLILALVEYKVNCVVDDQTSCTVGQWVMEPFETTGEAKAAETGEAKATESGEASDNVKAGHGLLFTFLILLLWLLFSGSDLAKAAIGGIAFRTVMAYGNTFQVGDRVTIKGHSGKLVEIGVFYLILVTLDDDKICLPTNSLWGAELTTANDGERSSLVVTHFYLSPTLSLKALQQTEDAIWDAIQASSYFEPSKPKQIFYLQQLDHIQLTAKAYVASTYNEPLFRSDITRLFLQFVKDNDILLANQRRNINITGTLDKVSSQDRNHDRTS